MLDRAAKLLGEAKNPLIVSGGGVLSSGAWNELRALAEMLQAPVVMSRNGRGAVSDREYLAQTALGGRELLPKADVILAVGTRFVEPATQWGLTPEQTVIHMDIDEEEVGRNFTPDRPHHRGREGGSRRARRAGRQTQPRPPLAREGTERPQGGAGEEDGGSAAAGGLREGAARRDAGRRDPHQREHAGRLLLELRLPGLPPAHLHHLRLSGDARLRLRDRPRRASRQPGQESRLDQRRRRLHVQRAGTLHAGARTTSRW